jgi:hypothetical protein
MADLNPEQMRILEELIDGFERLTPRVRNVSDALEKTIGDRFKKSLQAAMDAASDRAKADAAAAVATKKYMDVAAKDAAIEAAGKQAAAKVQREHNENIRQGIDTLKGMGDALGKLTKSVYSGEQGMKKYADAVEGVSTALGAFAFLLGGPVVKAVIAIVGGLGKFFKASVNMADSLFKGYQEVSRFGAAAGDGLQGIYGLMQGMRLSTEQMQQLSQIIGENAQGLALFGGSVFRGARDMAALRKNLTDTNIELEAFAYGMSPQELNETIGGFITMQSQMQTMDMRNMHAQTASIREYIKEQDILTKLTGATRKEQEAAAQKAMAIEQFRVKIANLEQENTAESRAEAERLRKTFTYLNQVAPDLAAGFAQMTTGFVGPGSVGSFLITNADALRAATDRSLTFAQTVDLVGNAVRSNLGQGGLIDTLGRFGKLNEVTGMSVRDLYNLGKITRGVVEQYERAETEQERQRILQENGLANMVKTQKADLDAMQSMQNFVELGVNPATTALSALARAAGTLASFLPGNTSRAQEANQAAASAAKAQGAGFFGQQFAGAKAGLKTTLGIGPKTTEDKLAALNFKDRAENTGGGAADPKLIDLAHKIQEMFPGARFTALNDVYHQRNRPGSKHTQGTALDVTMSPPPRNAEEADAIKEQIKKLGFSKVLDEYFRDRGPYTTGGHFHAELLTGGIATGPRSGYNAVLHGTEAVVPLPNGKTIPVEMSGMQVNMDRQIGILGQQLSKMDELISAMREQTSVSQRILQVSQA